MNEAAARQTLRVVGFGRAIAMPPDQLAAGTISPIRLRVAAILHLATQSRYKPHSAIAPPN